MQPKTSTEVGYSGYKRYLSPILSLIYMGAGQIYNGQYVKGILFALYHTFFLLQTPAYFFSHFKGLYTLGTTPGEDHSLFLLVEGVVSVALFLILLGIHIGNVIDARKNGKKADLGRKVPSIKDTLHNTIKLGYPYFTLGPGFIFLTLATVFPIIFTICIAFTNYDLYNSPPGNLLTWVGIKNFINIFTLGSWWRTIRSVVGWTVVWTLGATITTSGVGLFLAVVLNHPKIKFRRIFRSLLIIPWAIPWFIVALVWRYLLNYNLGHINKMIQALGFGKVPWLEDPLLAKISIILVNLWLGFPFFMALFSGILQNIPDDLYEAAEVSGASAWQKFKNITLPLVLHATVPLLIMQLGFNLNNFGLIYLLTDGDPKQFGTKAGATDILITWVYRLTFTDNKYNYASVISVLLFIVVAGFAIYQFRQTTSFQDEELMQ